MSGALSAAARIAMEKEMIRKDVIREAIFVCTGKDTDSIDNIYDLNELDAIQKYLEQQYCGWLAV